MLFMKSSIAKNSSDNLSGLSEVQRLVLRLGQRIKTARIRRKLRQEDLAQRCALSRSTIQAIERGEPTTAIGCVLQVLWILGLSNEVELLADPGLDREGLALALDAQHKRVYVSRKVDDDF